MRLRTGDQPVCQVMTASCGLCSTMWDILNLAREASGWWVPAHIHEGYPGRKDQHPTQLNKDHAMWSHRIGTSQSSCLWIISFHFTSFITETSINIFTIIVKSYSEWSCIIYNVVKEAQNDILLLACSKFGKIWAHCIQSIDIKPVQLWINSMFLAQQGSTQKFFSGRQSRVTRISSRIFKILLDWSKSRSKKL